MNATGLLIGALLIAVGVGIGIALAAGWWRENSAGRTNPTLEVAALLAPASDALVRVEQRLREVERDRAGAYAGLYEQVTALHRTSAELGAQTRSLVGALRAPAVRGRWGEVQLQRIVELAGMLEHCDFDTQVSAAVADAAGVRPDMIVRLAGGRHIPVDAKVPFDSWLQARESNDEMRQRQLMGLHARAVRAHVDALAAKSYWKHFQPSPEFVVMFVPGEPLLDAAMTVDPGLTEYAFSRKVVITTPTTLIALLRTVAFTWRQERLSESAEAIHALGLELHGRLATLGSHFSRLGNGLERAVDSYNSAVGSIESRVMVTARRFTDLGVSTLDLPSPEPVLTTPRRPQAPEWLAADGTPDPPVVEMATHHLTLDDLASGQHRVFGQAPGNAVG
ncbi:DNA recombination protein RmuC [Nakamurella sp. UYEF19]|uniref:DNA recombination protein RmuC n=1 Tax=Nakamurella sp. UYEF19 TaxID=1756392 RepID=UPI003396228B